MSTASFSESLPTALHTAESVRAIDREAIEKLGISGIRLMRRASEASLQLILKRWPECRDVTLFCGGGNNGGDGWLLAGLLQNHGINVNVRALVPPEKLTGEAAQAAAFARQSGINDLCSDNGKIDGPKHLIVDALLGTGYKNRPLGKIYHDAVVTINNSRAPVLALDIPSGLNADTGTAAEPTVTADCTITFVALKAGLFTADGVEHCGRLFFAPLGLPERLMTERQPAAVRLLPEQTLITLPRRGRHWHKGHCGHLLVIGGNIGMAGASLLSATAALRVGAGLVSVATHPDHAAALAAHRPELMVSPVRSGPEINELLEKADMLAVGPGLGRDSWAEQMLQQALTAQLPVVLDADALSLLGKRQFADYYHRKSEQFRLITPHPGEAGTLLDMTTAAVQADRFDSVRKLQQRWQAVTVLKGAGTLIADESETISLCDTGNAGMASGGMGDALTGILAGLLVQQKSINCSRSELVRLGVWLHGRAADRVRDKTGTRGMLASDIIDQLRGLLNDPEKD